MLEALLVRDRAPARGARRGRRLRDRERRARHRQEHGHRLRPASARPDRQGAGVQRRSELSAEPTDDWITNGGSLVNKRYSPLDEIDTSNVKEAQGRVDDAAARLRRRREVLGRGAADRLQGRRSTSRPARTTCSPSTSKTGKILWQYKANLDQKINTVCCGWLSRGVALGDGKVFIGQLDGKLVALDQKTGKVVWKTQVATGRTATRSPTRRSTTTAWSITGVSGGEFGIRGRVTAFDAKTGKEVWRFYTIPGPGETGHDTWPQDSDAWKHGGAPVWQTPSVDPEARAALLLDRQRVARRRRQRARRRQPLHALDRRARREDRRVQVALPEGAPRHLGLRRAEPDGPLRRRDGRPDGARHRARPGRPAGSTCSTARPASRCSRSRRSRCPQNANQKTAKTQPIPSYDAVHPARAGPTGRRRSRSRKHAARNEKRDTPCRCARRRDLHAVLEHDDGRSSTRRALRAGRTGSRRATTPRRTCSTSARRRGVAGYTATASRASSKARSRRASAASSPSRRLRHRTRATSRRSTPRRARSSGSKRWPGVLLLGLDARPPATSSSSAATTAS